MKNLSIKFLLSASVIIASSSIAMDGPPALSEQDIEEMRSEQIARQDQEYRELKWGAKYGHEEAADTSNLVDLIKYYLSNPNTTDFTAIKRLIRMLPNNAQELNNPDSNGDTILDRVTLKRNNASAMVKGDYEELISLLISKGATGIRFPNPSRTITSKMN